MDKISIKAYAKINLGLDVVRKLDNGYHEVKMVMQNIDIFDKVNLKKIKTDEIKVNTNLPFLPTGPDNLVYKAAELLKKEFQTGGVDIDLYKFIPVAAGMAGGSSDAAAVLRGMNEMYDLGLSKEELMKRGSTLGADIPYCILGGTALAEGIGEHLTKLPPCPSCYVIIGKPAINVSTKYVYEHLKLDEFIKHPDIDGIVEGIYNQELFQVTDRLENVLEMVTEKAYPVIGKIKEDMIQQGALNSLMSGSGPSVFGIFDDKQKAEQCKNFLKKSKYTKNVYIARLIDGGM